MLDDKRAPESSKSQGSDAGRVHYHAMAQHIRARQAAAAERDGASARESRASIFNFDARRESRDTTPSDQTRIDDRPVRGVTTVGSHPDATGMVVTVRPGESTAVKRTAVKRELPAWRSVEEWPARWSASGRMTLSGSDPRVDPQAKRMCAVCRIHDGLLTLGTKQRAAAGEETEKVVAEVPVEVLAVGLQRGRANMLTLATLYRNEMFDEIYCFCDNPIRRNRWIHVFRRMGVAIFDMRD